MDGLRHHEIALLVPQRVRERGYPQVAGLHRHDLLEVRLAPDAAGRVLITTAPGRIEEVALTVDGLPRHLRRRCVAAPGALQGVLDAGRVEILVPGAPATVLRVVPLDVSLLEL